MFVYSFELFLYLVKTLLGKKIYYHIIHEGYGCYLLGSTARCICIFLLKDHDRSEIKVKHLTHKPKNNSLSQKLQLNCPFKQNSLITPWKRIQWQIEGLYKHSNRPSWALFGITKKWYTNFTHRWHHIMTSGRKLVLVLKELIRGCDSYTELFVWPKPLRVNTTWPPPTQSTLVAPLTPNTKCA